MAPSKDYLCRVPDEVEECDIDVLQAELEVTKEEVIDLKTENTKLRWQLSKAQEEAEQKGERCEQLEAGRKRLIDSRQKLKAASELALAAAEEFQTQLASAQAEVAVFSHKLKELEADSHKRMEELERSRKSEEVMERELIRVKRNQDELVQKNSKALVVIDQLQEKIRNLESSLGTQKDLHEGVKLAPSHEHPEDVVPAIPSSVNESERKEEEASSHHPVKDSKASNAIREDWPTEASPASVDHDANTLADAFTQQLTLLQTPALRRSTMSDSRRSGIPVSSARLSASQTASSALKRSRASTVVSPTKPTFGASIARTSMLPMTPGTHGEARSALSATRKVMNAQQPMGKQPGRDNHRASMIFPNKPLIF